MDRVVCWTINEHSLKVGGKPILCKGKIIMAKKINGKIYYLVDMTFDDDIIYEIYEDKYGNQVVIPFEVRG